MKRVVAPDILTENEFDDILIQSTNSDTERTIEFDFSQTTFVSSFAMILFVLHCENLVNNHRKNIVFKFSKSGKNCQCMYILARLGLFDCLPEGIKYYPYQIKRKSARGSNAAILEVTKIHDKDEAEDMISRVEVAIEKDTNYPRDQVLDICTMVSEILQNIITHSESQRASLISIQSYPYQRYVQLVIADVGVGIPETIRKADEYRGQVISDEKAILESVKKGVSRFGRVADRGEGLSKCIQLAAKHKAKIYIRSNSGFAYFSFQKAEKVSSTAELLKGTQIYVNYPIL